MKKIILSAALSLLISAVSYADDADRSIPAATPEQKVVEIHMATKAAVIAADSKRTRKTSTMPLPGQATCSGAFIDSMGDILTARHCVNGFDSFEVVTADHQRYTAVVIATSTIHDLALIHVDKRDTPYFLPAPRTVRGEAIFILGSPLGITDTLSTGIVARVDGDMTLVDCSALPGNSGGPVFNADGLLVGVASAGFIVLYGTTHLNIIQGLDAVQFFLFRALKDYYGHR